MIHEDSFPHHVLMWSTNRRRRCISIESGIGKLPPATAGGSSTLY
jgi:hypothetical protein